MRSRVMPTTYAADRLTWMLIAAMLLGFVAVTRDAPFTIAPLSTLGPLAGLTALIGLWQIGHRRALPNLSVAAIALLQMTLFTLAALLLSYALAAQQGAPWDARLLAWDRALGFDWPAIRGALDRSWAAVWTLTFAYHSLVPQMVLVILLLSARGLHGEVRVTVCAAVLAGFATVIMSGAVPAFGNMFDPARDRNLPASIAWHHAETIRDLRSGALRTLDLSRLMGIVTFPSYHAALALVFLRAYAWLPRAQAWPLGTLAVLTIVATPVAGGHYAVDVLAGLLLACASLLVAARLASARAARHSDALVAEPA